MNDKAELKNQLVHYLSLLGIELNDETLNLWLDNPDQIERKVEEYTHYFEHGSRLVFTNGGRKA